MLGISVQKGVEEWEEVGRGREEVGRGERVQERRGKICFVSRTGGLRRYDFRVLCKFISDRILSELILS